MVSFGLATFPIFVIVPVALVVRALTVIVGYVAPDAIGELVVQLNELVATLVLHVHGATFGTVARITHTGRVSVTVVIPVEVIGPSFLI